jgi:hypothetical protein
LSEDRSIVGAIGRLEPFDAVLLPVGLWSIGYLLLVHPEVIRVLVAANCIVVGAVGALVAVVRGATWVSNRRNGPTVSEDGR